MVKKQLCIIYVGNCSFSVVLDPHHCLVLCMNDQIYQRAYSRVKKKISTLASSETKDLLYVPYDKDELQDDCPAKRAPGGILKSNPVKERS